MVVWTSKNQDLSGYGIYAQRYDSNNLRFSDEFQINTYTTGDQYSPVVATFEDGGFIVTWQSDGQDGSSNGIYGRQYDASSFPLGNEFKINTYTQGAQSNPSVAALTHGERSHVI